ncbi:ciliary microtubule-associated protein 2-like isoform X2 [Brachyhypopomus gauderio]|uniref:ciliary microtubule-associated protein 2-like isoform X2 n=1 Tax=Brachyhypopomus gauderio TaxID=698409 RepID=UPI004042ABF3
MTEKRFKGAPFGTQSARFDVSGVHPANKRLGTYTQIPYCRRRTSDLERNLGPGTYNIDCGDFSARAVQERAKGPGWKRAQETARLAQMPHLLYRDVWENKQFLKYKVGPGTYRITSFTEELEKKPGCPRGICETREERFKDCQSWTPGPGTYGKGGIPSAALEEKERRSVGSCPSMDYNTTPRSFPNGTTDCGLGPGSYNLKSFTELILRGGVSKRGPYDLFTGHRNQPISYGYFATPRRANLNLGKYTKEVPKFGEELQRPEKRKHGVFSRREQYPRVPTERVHLCSLTHCPRPATFPGPGWYDVNTTILMGQSRRGKAAPFLSSSPRVSKRAESWLYNHNIVGPGQYDITRTSQSSSGSGYRSSFVSGTQRYPQCPATDKYRQERLRPINVPVDRSCFLQPHSTFNGERLFSSA